jgi:hypothetical protein
MAALHKSVATLRIGGDALKPDAVSKLLGCQPSFAFAKGDIKPSKIRPIVRKSGMWALEATKRQPDDLDAQITEIFSRLPADLAVWARLRQDFDMDIFCGFWMRESDEGMTVSVGTMKILSERGIRLGFCLYAPLPDDEAEVQPSAGGSVE